MKLSQFTPSVNKNTMNAKIQAVDHPNAYGANQAGANALNATLSAGIGAYQKEWLKDQNDKIFDAKNDYEQRINTLMDDENTGLFNTHQGKAAENL